MPTAGYAVHGEVAVITLENPPVNTLAHGVRKGIAEGLDKAAWRPEREGDRAHRRGERVLRRRRDPRVQHAGGDGDAAPARGDRDARREHEAGDRRDPQGRDGRRARARARLPLPDRRAGRAARAARGEARDPARRRRHAAPAARDRRQGGARHDHLRQPDRLRQGAAPVSSTRSLRATSCRRRWHSPGKVVAEKRPCAACATRR